MQAWILPEILCHIREHASQSSFAALCRTSRAIYNVGQPVLYESVHLNMQQAGQSLRSIRLLRKIIETSPYIAHYIKHLVALFPRSNTEFDKGVFKNLWPILDKCSHLLTLRVSYPNPLSRTFSLHFDNSISRLRHLQGLHVDVNHLHWCDRLPGQSDVNVSLLTLATQLPSLGSVTMTLQEGNLRPLSGLLALSTTNRITTLCLQEAFVSMEAMDIILRWLPHLKHLVLSFVGFADVERCSHVKLSWDELGQALARSVSTLESLDIATDDSHAYDDIEMSIAMGFVRNEGGHWKGSGRLGSLKSFERLEKLSLAPEVLLGVINGKPPLLSDFLPDSLRHLCLRQDELNIEPPSGWNGRKLGKCLLAYARGTPKPQLKGLTLPCSEGVQDEWDYDQVEILFDEFKQAGVHFEMYDESEL